MEFFDFLRDISPWWWVAFGLGLGALEMATMSFFLIWPALAALVTAGILAMAPATSGALQITYFAIFAVVLTFVGRYLLNRFGDGGEVNETLNARANLMIGRHAEVLAFSGPEGHVKIDGIRWRALWQEGLTAQEGDTVHITDADGMTLIVSGA